MSRLLSFTVLAAVVTGAAGAAAQAPTAKDTDAERFAKWEKNVAAIEKRLKDKPPPAEPVVFAGSSSIVRWDLAKSFPGKPAVNVGFGGSQIRDCAHFAPRLVGPLKPAAVVFYAGDNDINAGRTPEQVRDDFRKFVDAVQKDAPKAKVWFVTIKPSVARWKQAETQAKANALVKEYAATDPRLGVIDVTAGMLGSDGTPDPKFFVKDGLHMTDAGYAVWAAAVGKALGW
jgi:lysophospholipase L1-like esterase